jgi:hypothetical protein
MSTKVTARELKGICSSYDDAVRDYSACSNAKELEYWARCAECSIDRHVQTLDRGVSKQNRALMLEVSEAYQRLQAKLNTWREKAPVVEAYSQRLRSKTRSGNVIPLFR